MLWRVHIRIRQKLALAALFCLVLITMAISIIRFAVVMNFSSQTESTWLFLWNAIENNIGKEENSLDLIECKTLVDFFKAIIIVCLASFRVLFTQQKHISGDSENSRKKVLLGSRSFTGPGTKSSVSHAWPSNLTISKLPSKGSDFLASEECIKPLDRVLVQTELEVEV